VAAAVNKESVAVDEAAAAINEDSADTDMGMDILMETMLADEASTGIPLQNEPTGWNHVLNAASTNQYVFTSAAADVYDVIAGFFGHQWKCGIPPSLTTQDRSAILRCVDAIHDFMTKEEKDFLLVSEPPVTLIVQWNAWQKKKNDMASAFLIRFKAYLAKGQKYVKPKVSLHSLEKLLRTIKEKKANEAVSTTTSVQSTLEAAFKLTASSAPVATMNSVKQTARGKRSKH
jgi:hypothetical protein